MTSFASTSTASGGARNTVDVKTPTQRPDEKRAAASFASVCCHSVPVSSIASHVTLHVAHYLPNRLQKNK